MKTETEIDTQINDLKALIKEEERRHPRPRIGVIAQWENQIILLKWVLED